MLITVVNIIEKSRDDVKNIGAHIIRDANNGIDAQFDTNKFRMRIRDYYIKIYNKEIHRSLTLWDSEFRSIDVRT